MRGKGSLAGRQTDGLFGMRPRTRDFEQENGRKPCQAGAALQTMIQIITKDTKSTTIFRQPGGNSPGPPAATYPWLAPVESGLTQKAKSRPLRSVNRNRTARPARAERSLD